MDFRIRRVAWSCHGEHIAALRRAAGSAAEQDGDDPHTLHFVACDGDELAAAVRITFAAQTPIDFETLLSTPLPQQSRGEFVSAGRFVVAPSARRHVVPLLKALIRESWMVAWPRGARIALVTAPERLVSVYRRVIGTVPLGPTCAHPRTGRAVRLMAYRPMSGGRGVIDDLVDALPGPPASADALSYLRQLEQTHADS